LDKVELSKSGLSRFWQFGATLIATRNDELLIGREKRIHPAQILALHFERNARVSGVHQILMPTIYLNG